MFTAAYIFFHRGNVVTSHSIAINNYSEREIALQFYATAFSNEKSTFFYLRIYSVFHKHSSIILPNSETKLWQRQ